MVELSDFLNPRNLLVAGGITMEVLLSACGGGTKILSPEDYCDMLKREEFVPYGNSVVIRDIFEGRLSVLAEVTITRENFLIDNLEFIKEGYENNFLFMGYDKTKDGVEGSMVTYGPKICFDPIPKPIVPNQPEVSVIQQLNPHLYGGKDGRMPLNPPKTIHL